MGPTPAVDRPAIVSDEGEQDGVDDCVEELDAGDGPLLQEPLAEGENEDFQRAQHQSRPRPQAEENRRPDEQLRPRQRVREGMDQRRGQGRGRELLHQPGDEMGQPARDARRTVHQDVDTQRQPQQAVGGFIGRRGGLGVVPHAVESIKFRDAPAGLESLEEVRFRIAANRPEHRKACLFSAR